MLAYRGLDQKLVDRQPPPDLQTIANEFVKAVANAAAFVRPQREVPPCASTETRHIPPPRAAAVAVDDNDNDDCLAHKQKRRRQKRRKLKPWGGMVGTKSEMLKDSDDLKIKAVTPVVDNLSFDYGQLEEAMTETYEDEDLFNIALFEALRACLSGYEVDQPNTSYVLMKSERSTKYAVGFARQVRASLDLFDKKMGGKSVASTESTRSGMTSVSNHEHAVCLFQRNKSSDEWEPLDCFAVVKLKMSDTSCVEFTRHSKTANIEPSNRLGSHHAALSQVTLYNIGCVLLYHARRGKLGKKPLPLAIVAATRQQPRNEKVTVAASRKPAAKQARMATVAAPKVAASRKAAKKQGAKKLSFSFIKRARELALQAKRGALAFVNVEAKKAVLQTTEEGPIDANARKLKRARWVSGQLHVPEALGNRFYFSVKDFGCFDDENSIENALALYLETMLFGLNVAIQVLHELADADDVPPSPPVPASGQRLMIGSAPLAQLEYCASPIVGANLTKFGETWTVTQGDLYIGKLAVHGFLKFARSKVVFLSRGVNETVELDVLVKVSSTAVHSVLVNPLSTYDALREIRFADSFQFEEPLKKLVDELGSVLYAVVGTDVGLLTVMADLSKKGYVSLQPIDYENDLSTLWDAFSELVNKVLLPMAEIATVIHPDIRPGYDATSNILVRDNTSEGNVSMKLVDYESLVRFPKWEAPATGRYLQRREIEDATTFVWWQCVAMAYFWSEKIDVKPPRGEETMRILKRDDGPQWLMNLRGRVNGKVTPAQVKSTLVDLANVFQTDRPVGESA
jgi:hypothetical protein